MGEGKSKIEYITITEDSFKHKQAIQWKQMDIPGKLVILDGYSRPEYKEEPPEFSSWIDRTIATGKGKVIDDTIKFLELKSAYYEWLAHIGEYNSKEARVHRRLEDGIGILEEALKELPN